MQLANKIDPNRFDIYLTYLDNENNLFPKIFQPNLKLIECFKRKGKFDFRVVYRLAKLLHHIDVDIVYCVNEYPLLYGFLAKHLLRYRHESKHNIQLLVSIHHSTLLHSPWENTKNILYHHLLNQCDRVVFVSKLQKKHWNEAYQIDKRKSEQIYNGVDYEIFDSDIYADSIDTIRAKFNFRERDFVVGICAVLRTEKNHIGFIRALKQCRLRGQPVKGLIIGDGPERKAIQEFAASVKMSAHIRISGFQEDVRPLVACCDCIVNASHSVEAHSIAALEAMAMGKTVVMSNVGGASEMIIHGHDGFLYDFRNQTALAALLDRLIANPVLNRQVGTNAKKRVRETFSLTKMAGAYERLFEEVASGVPP